VQARPRVGRRVRFVDRGSHVDQPAVAFEGADREGSGAKGVACRAKRGQRSLIEAMALLLARLESGVVLLTLVVFVTLP
jgi:hypothetical protein